MRHPNWGAKLKLFLLIDVIRHTCTEHSSQTHYSQLLFRERLSGIVGGFESTVFQRNLKEWQERSWTYVCEC